MSSGGLLYLEVNGDIIRGGAGRGPLVVGFDVVTRHLLLRLALCELRSEDGGGGGARI